MGNTCIIMTDHAPMKLENTTLAEWKGDGLATGVLVSYT